MSMATVKQIGVEITRQRVESWCDGVLDGSIAACKWTRLAVQRYRRDVETGHERGLYHDPAAVQIWVEFFLCLRHFEGDFAGQPIDLDDWELFVVWNVFGWMRADGTRRFRTAYIEIARKVGKSTFGGGVGLSLLVIDGEAGPQVYSAAVDKQHARKVLHSKAEKYVKASPPLRRKLDIAKTTGRISFEANDGFYEPLGKDSDVGEGFNPHGTIFDELHAHKTREMWDVIDSGLGARSQPLKLAITTAGFDTSSFCYTEIRDQVCQILEGVIEDDTWWGCIWTIDEGDDWKDETCWAKANPQSYFDTQIEDMRRMAREAQRKPGALNNFLTKRLNVWTTQTARWVNLDEWKKSPAVFPDSSLTGKLCYSGLDLSANTDISGVVHLFPLSDDELVIVPRFWIPADRIGDREHRDAAQYERWVREGLITATPGNVIDYKIVKAAIEKDFDAFDVQKLAYDPWGPAEAIRQSMLDAGMPEDKWIQFRQGFASMSPAMKTTERLYLQHRIRGLNHPVMLWMASNLQARTDPAGNVKPDKAATAKRIDGMVCLFMAVGIWSVAAPAKATLSDVIKKEGKIVI
jgi:phage terminase large subunit-like protein